MALTNEQVRESVQYSIEKDQAYLDWFINLSNEIKDGKPVKIHCGSAAIVLDGTSPITEAIQRELGRKIDLWRTIIKERTAIINLEYNQNNKSNKND